VSRVSTLIFDIEISRVCNYTHNFINYREVSDSGAFHKGLRIRSKEEKVDSGRETDVLKNCALASMT
jgi:hypothetical protein